MTLDEIERLAIDAARLGCDGYADDLTVNLARAVLVMLPVVRLADGVVRERIAKISHARESTKMCRLMRELDTMRAALTDAEQTKGAE